MPTRKKNDLERRYAVLGLKIVSEFGAAIAVPVVLGTIAGRRLDAAYGTKPAFLIAGFALAAVLSAFYVVRRARAYGREYDALNAESKDAKPAGNRT
ncbi:MAG TPA: AtpZ/AtpI family protein [Patescibacteria group bacterium]|nr:AtpZ/AtpI family protein [Patescibacteria group bacterium]